MTLENCVESKARQQIDCDLKLMKIAKLGDSCCEQWLESFDHCSNRPAEEVFIWIHPQKDKISFITL